MTLRGALAQALHAFFELVPQARSAGARAPFAGGGAAHPPARAPHPAGHALPVELANLDQLKVR